MLIAVTGATGFVGGRLVRALHRRGHDVLSFGRHAAPDLPGFRSWDVASGPIDVPVVDGVVHCAALVKDWGSPAAFEATNVRGTGVVLETFAAARRFVYVSTSSVYDPARLARLLAEDAPYGERYLNAYARTKMQAEQIIRASGRPSIILRPHAVYGPGDPTLVPRLLAARRLGCQLAVGSGRNVLSVTHVDNLVHAIEQALEGPCVHGIFNVADAVSARLDDLLRTVLRRFGLPERIVYLPTSQAAAVARVLEWGYRRVGSTRAPLLTPYIVHLLARECTLDISAAQRQLGYAPAVHYLNAPL